MSEEKEYISIELEETVIKNYMDDIELIISSPESYGLIEIPASSDITYQHVYVSVVP